VLVSKHWGGLCNIPQAWLSSYTSFFDDIIGFFNTHTWQSQGSCTFFVALFFGCWRVHYSHTTTTRFLHFFFVLFYFFSFVVGLFINHTHVYKHQLLWVVTFWMTNFVQFFFFWKPYIAELEHYKLQSRKAVTFSTQHLHHVFGTSLTYYFSNFNWLNFCKLFLSNFIC
jgi:hypothetical protein